MLTLKFIIMLLHYPLTGGRWGRFRGRGRCRCRWWWGNLRSILDFSISFLVSYCRTVVAVDYWVIYLLFFKREHIYIYDKIKEPDILGTLVSTCENISSIISTRNVSLPSNVILRLLDDLLNVSVVHFQKDTDCDDDEVPDEDENGEEDDSWAIHQSSCSVAFCTVCTWLL